MHYSERTMYDATFHFESLQDLTDTVVRLNHCRDGVSVTLSDEILAMVTPYVADHHSNAPQLGKVLAEREREYEIGDVWRDGRAWKVKLPGGIHTTTTKRHATAFAAALLTIKED